MDRDSGTYVLVNTTGEDDGLALLVTGPAGALGCTTTREGGAGNQNIALTSGTLCVASLFLKANKVISNLSWYVGTTAATTPSHTWFALLDSNLNYLALTADQTTTAIPASTATTFPLTSPFTTTYSGLYYLGAVSVAATAFSLGGSFGANGSSAVPPIKVGFSTTGLTAPPTLPAQAGALTAKSTVPWGWVS